MGRLLGLGSPWIGLALGLVPQASLHAQSARVPVSLEYAAHPECPAEPAFISQVELRSPRVELVSPENAGWRMSVTILREGTGSRGWLRIVDPAGQTSERSVAAASCAEVVSALALVAALTADPDATEQKTAPADQPNTAPGLPAETQEIDRKVERPAARPVVRSPLGPTRAVAPSGVRHWWAMGLDVSGQTALGPNPTAVLGLFLEGGLGEAEWLLPAARLRVAQGSQTITTASNIEVSVTCTTARLEISFQALRPTDRLAVRPGVYFEAGTYVGDFQDDRVVAEPDNLRTQWATVGIMSRGTYRVIGPLALELSAGAFMPLIANTFSFSGPQDDETIYDVPFAGGFISAAIGLTTR